MNANELADDLDYACTISEPRITMMGRMHMAATMLRQQQAEIEALKNGFNTTWAGTSNSEMAEVRARANVDGHSSMEQLKWFARAILRKAQNK